MFVSFEGMEGSGKSSALNALADEAETLGHTVVRTREPGGSAIGGRLRALLLDERTGALAPETELFLYLADRAEHVHSLIRPALERGDIVFSDRYADSTVVYQGFARGLSPDALFELNNKAAGGLWPDYTLLFDVDPAVGLARARQRNEEAGATEREGRYEAESLAFHTKVRQGFLTWAARFPARFRIIDANRTQEEVLAAAKQALGQLFQHQ